MSRQKDEFISDKTLLIWLFLSVISSIACLLVTAVVVYVIYDCWIMYQHQLAGGVCDAGLSQGVVIAIPIVLGVIVSTVLTRKLIKADSSNTGKR